MVYIPDVCAVYYTLSCGNTISEEDNEAVLHVRCSFISYLILFFLYISIFNEVADRAIMVNSQGLA